MEREAGPAAPSPRTSKRAWIVPLLLLTIVGAMLVLPRREAARPERPGVANPPPPRLRFIGLPSGLSDRTVDRPVRIAFSATQPVPEGRAQLFQLWRLDLPTGELTPGPIVGEVVAIRYAPRDSGRLAFLVRGGGLFVLDGFLGSRPTWVDGDVSAFDFAPDGNLAYAKVERRSASTGRAVADVRIGLLEPDRTSPSNVRSRTIRSLNVRGFTVRGGRFIAWGVRDGEERTLVWRAKGGEVRRRPRIPPGRRARSGAGFWVLDHPSARGGPGGVPTDPAHLAIADGMTIWAAGHALRVADPASLQDFLVELPDRFPTPTGPIAAAESDGGRR